jgi:hypothetical protein
MKKLLFISVMLTLSLSASSQCVDPQITDFECDTPSHPLAGKITTIANPYPQGINTSAHVGEFSDDGKDGWDNLNIDYVSEIDLSTNNILRFKIYTPKSIQVLAKIEGGTVKQIWSDFSIVDQWQDFLFDFSAAAGAGNTKLILFFNADKEDGTSNDIYYIDDLEWIKSSDLSVHDLSMETVNIYPNPSSTLVSIEAEEFDVVEVFDSIGKLIKTIDGQKNINLDVSNFDSGIYLILLSNKDFSVTKRLLVE